MVFYAFEMLHRIADALFPPTCHLCGVRIPQASDPFCARCRVLCETCRAHRPLGAAPARAHAAFLYRGAAREALLAFKYRDRHRLGPWLAARMAETAQRELPVGEITAVTAVPLHWLKRRLRGADPVASLGRQVAARLGKPWRPRALSRTRWTATQTRLDAAQRRRNVTRAFRARAQDVAGGVVLLIDDILTTGATSRACALALRRAGASAVFVLAAAGTPAKTP